MTHLSWNEIADRATGFVSKWQGETYEKVKAKISGAIFWPYMALIVDAMMHSSSTLSKKGDHGFYDMISPGI